MKASKSIATFSGEPAIRRFWLFNPRSQAFEEYTLNVQPVSFTRTPDICWYLAEVPQSLQTPPEVKKGKVELRKWMIIEGGTGYILTFGSTEEACNRAARLTFTVEGGGRTQADIKCYIQYQIQLLTKVFEGRQGFVAPKIEKKQNEQAQTY